MLNTTELLHAPFRWCSLSVSSCNTFLCVFSLPLLTTTLCFLLISWNHFVHITSATLFAFGESVSWFGAWLISLHNLYIKIIPILRQKKILHMLKRILDIPSLWSNWALLLPEARKKGSIECRYFFLSSFLFPFIPIEIFLSCSFLKIIKNCFHSQQC